MNIIERELRVAMGLASCPGDERSVQEALAVLDALLASHEKLRAEVEALRADAERYRWLREDPSKHGDFQDTGKPWAVHVIRVHGVPTQSACTGAQLDALIDAARATGQAGAPT